MKLTSLLDGLLVAAARCAAAPAPASLAGGDLVPAPSAFEISGLSVQAQIGDKVSYNFNVTATNSPNPSPFHCFALIVNSSPYRGGLSNVSRRLCTSTDNRQVSDSNTAISWKWDQVPVNPSSTSSGGKSAVVHARQTDQEAILTVYSAHDVGVHRVPASDITWVGGSNPVLRRQLYIGPQNFIIPLLD